MSTKTDTIHSIVNMVVAGVPTFKFSVAGDPDTIHAELKKRGFDEETFNGSQDVGYAIVDSETYLFLDDYNPDAGWFAFLKGEETTATRHSELDAKLEKLLADYIEMRTDLIAGYLMNSTEEEQLNVLAEDPSHRVVAALANSPHEVTQEAVVNKASSEESPNLEALIAISLNSEHDVAGTAHELACELIHQKCDVAAEAIATTTDIGFVY